MSVNMDAPAQNRRHVLQSTSPTTDRNAGGLICLDSVPSLVEGELPVSKIPTGDGEEAISGVTDVQRPFSLADHDVDREAAPSDAPLLLRCPKGGLLRLGFASCDLEAGSWQVLPSSDIVPQLPADFAGSFGGIYSGGGLVLMEKFAKQQYHLLVSNPTGKSQRQLPPIMDFSNPEILGIFVDPTTASFKIPVVQRKFNEKEMDLVLMQEYDSISNSWEFAGQWRNRFQVEPIGAVYVNGTLFFLTYDRQAHVKERQQRVHHIYYLNDYVWERLELPLGLAFPTIFEYRARLMLVGGLHDYALDNVDGSESNVLRAVYIWEHDWLFMRWIDVCTMPCPWVDELYKCTLEEPRCTLEVVAGGDFVCVASTNGKVAKYDLNKSDWAWLPKCDLAKYGDGDRILMLERRPDVPT